MYLFIISLIHESIHVMHWLYDFMLHQIILMDLQQYLGTYPSTASPNLALDVTWLLLNGLLLPNHHPPRICII